MKKKKTKKGTKDYHEKYKAVCAALAYFAQLDIEENNREEAKRKAQRVIMRLSLIGSILMVAFSIVTKLTFDFTWMADFGEWYNEFYVALMIYVVLTAIVLFLEKKFKLDQKPAFGYIWPFIGYFISIFISKSIVASIVTAEFNFIAGSVMIGAILAYLSISYFVKIGKYKGMQEVEIAKKAYNILEENPEIAEDVLNDFERDNNNHGKVEENDE